MFALDIQFKKLYLLNQKRDVYHLTGIPFRILKFLKFTTNKVKIEFSFVD